MVRWLLAPIVFLVAMDSCCRAAEVSPQQREHTLVFVQLADGESAGVLSKDFTPIDYAPSDNGIVWTAPPGRYAVIVSGGLTGMQILPVEIKAAIVPPGPVPPGPVPPGPDPVPPTPPEPLDGVGSRLYPIFVAIGDKPNAAKLATNFRTVLNGMNDGSIPSALVARTKLVNLNNGLRLPMKWKTGVDAITVELDGALVVGDVQKIFRGTIAALELSAK